MKYPNTFISATKEYNTFEESVPAPYIRKSFVSDTEAKGKITVASCGFYELYINGKNITKGFLAPYIGNPKHYIYCDSYDVTINKGENVIGILLGNGFQNNPGGYIWDFDKAEFRSAPMVALDLSYFDKSGNEIIISTDSSFKTAPSATRSDDYRFGIFYDANYEIDGWNEKGFDDSMWDNAFGVQSPGGELKLCEATPIVIIDELKPVEIRKVGDKFLYDFGISHSGVCRLTVNGAKGQKIEMQHADSINEDGSLDFSHVWFMRDMWERDKEIVHKDTYVCKGTGTEVFVPKFTYHGFRFVEVSGITEAQATKDLITFEVFHSALETRGGFSCSDDIANTLQEITRRSVVSNFHYFPTDCPQREKNGWTADAALSCEHTLLNFNPEVNYREWLRNICKAQAENGALPGIIPTTGWGYDWGNGPAWDSVLAYLPYYTYIYRGETEMIRESSACLLKYLKYLTSRTDEKGLLHIGLGDWCHVGRDEPKAPLVVTDSVIAMDIANKAAFMFEAVGMNDKKAFATNMAEKLRKAIRENLIDWDTQTVYGKCQTCQAMGIYYNVFEPGEMESAYNHLIDLIHQENDHIDVGVLGGRIIFHVLTMFGDSNLAYKMITRPDYPSYGNWVKRGATTLWEDFWPDKVYSMNHHFWGDISAWFIKCIAGIRLNPDGGDISTVDIRPSFIDDLTHADGFHISPNGKISSSWERKDNKIYMSVKIPDSINARAILENGYCFADGETQKIITTGKYEVQKR